MYLIVFVTLVISLISTYTQVLAIEISRVAAAQTGAAQTMLTWHGAAVSMAASIIDTSTSAAPLACQYTQAIQTSGCSLSNDKLGGAAFPRCPSPWNGTACVNAWGTVTDGGGNLQYIATKPPGSLKQCAGLTAATCTATNGDCGGTQCTTSFKTLNYEFYSILYRSTGGTDLVVTYAPPFATTGTVQLASNGGTPTSLTPSDLLRQIRNLQLSSYTFGTVSGTCGGGNPGGNTIIGGPTPYSVPCNARVPIGSVAVIGFPDGL